MEDQTITTPASNRRVFYLFRNYYYQIFNLIQNPNDASIYFSAPSFSEIVWLIPSQNTNNAPTLLSYQLKANGKLSLHGSGITHVRPHSPTDNNGFSIKGNCLKNSKDNTFGMRHLLTLFPTEPSHKPNSPAFARKSDDAFRSSHAHPYVMVLWAIPNIDGLKVHLESTFHTDDLEAMPPDMGWGAFNMLSHSVLWLAYHTKYMANWPKVPHACYYDGELVPLIIGTSESTFRLEMKKPIITFQDNQLQIKI